MRIDTKITRKLGLGPHPSDGIVEDLEAWIEEQLNSDPIRLSIARVLDSSPSVVEWPKRLNLTLEDRVERLVSFRRQSDELDNLKLPANERDTRFDKLKSKYWAGYIDQHKFAHAQVYSKDHVNLRLATFWLNHFTVAESNLVVAELIQNYFEEAIFANLDNSFSDMLFDAISHPAMLTYLDNIYSIGENSITAKDCRARPDCFKGLNDNLGRELLELHTVSPARRYTEADIKSAAEILAGWGYIFDKPPPRNAGLRQLYIEKHAEPGRKTVLGKTFGPGKAALRKLTDYLAEDPATIRHLAGKLALHFIGDEYARENTDAIEAAWTRSKGSLRDIHATVLREAAKSPHKKFLTPNLWLYQILRMSDAHLFTGHEEMEGDSLDDVERRPRHIHSEIGYDFWSRRQPNGFSDRKVDWVSSEHLDRRVRLADMIFRYCKPRLNAGEMIENYGFPESTRKLVQQSNSKRIQFILFACSKDFMEV